MSSHDAQYPLEAIDIEKIYKGGDGSELRILRGVTVRVRAGEAVAIVGASGTGKSTLLQILGALDRPSSGEILVTGRPLTGHSDDEIAEIRNRGIGFVFQFHHLLREFTAEENVMVPCMINGKAEADARKRAREVLGWVGLDHRLDHRPRQLSGGEQQRVAVARALANEPAVLLADEPSGNLDESTSTDLHDLLFRLQADQGLSMVIVTHDRGLAHRCDRTLTLSDGLLVEQETPAQEGATAGGQFNEM
jgi:lipoprotein-releasing system ATP-binding protein